MVAEDSGHENSSTRLRTRLRDHQHVQRIKLAIIRRALRDPVYRKAILTGGESLDDKRLRATFDLPLREGVKLKAVAETPDHLYLLVPFDVSDIWLPMALVDDPIIRITSRAATDPVFRDRLVADPKAVLLDMVEVGLPKAVQLEVLVDTASLRHVVVPVTGRVRADVSQFKEALLDPCILNPNRTNDPCARSPDITRVVYCPYPPTTQIDDCSGVTTDDDCVTATTEGDCGSVTTNACGTPSTASCDSATTIDDCDFFTLNCDEFFTLSCSNSTDDGCEGGLAQTDDDDCGGGGLNSPTTECSGGGAPVTETGCTGTPDQPLTDDQTPLFF